MGQICFPIGDGTESLDTFYAYFRLPEAGYTSVAAGPDVRWYHTVLHEIPPQSPVPWDITQERPGYHLRATVAFRDLNAADFDGLFVSGGRAPEYLRYHAELLRFVQEIAAAGKPIACLCHGIEILTAANVIQGKRVTTVPKCAFDATQGGAIYEDRPCIVDGRIVTGRGYQDNPDVMKAFLRLLADTIS